jgi:hypothetical protein
MRLNESQTRNVLDFNTHNKNSILPSYRRGSAGGESTGSENDLRPHELSGVGGDLAESTTLPGPGHYFNNPDQLTTFRRVKAKPEQFQFFGSQQERF